MQHAILSVPSCMRKFVRTLVRFEATGEPMDQRSPSQKRCPDCVLWLAFLVLVKDSLNESQVSIDCAILVEADINTSPPATPSSTPLK